ncbi:hypothetical protein [Cupriavidus basilensis]|nr:hypothetical protein [Cupriavidus basilensis]
MPVLTLLIVALLIVGVYAFAIRAIFHREPKVRGRPAGRCRRHYRRT